MSTYRISVYAAAYGDKADCLLARVYVTCESEERAREIAEEEFPLNNAVYDIQIVQ